MSKHEFPKWVYHYRHAPKIVNSADEHKELGSEWAESPAHFEKKETKETKEETKDVVKPAPKKKGE